MSAPRPAELDVVVEKLVPGGQGLARTADGIVFVRGALPGERVRVHVTKSKKGLREARVLAVLDASPHRVAPDCALHPRCGGCDLLDLATPAQHDVKHAMLLDALARIGKFDADALARVVRPLAAPGAGDDARRRRARFSVGPGGALTYSARGSHDRVVIDACPALHPALDAARAQLALEGLPPGMEVRVAVDDSGTASVARAGGPPPALLPALMPALLYGEVAPGVAGGPYVSDASVFTQATRFGSTRILAHVLEACGDVSGLRVLELFAGSGHLSCALVRAGAQLDAVEGDEDAVRFLRRNLTQAGAAPTSGRVAFIDETLPFDAHDVLVADPPRTGIPSFSQLLARSGAARLVLVSCDLATGARDLAIARQHGYAVVWIQPIDAFPRTSHLETVTLLIRSEVTR